MLDLDHRGVYRLYVPYIESAHRAVLYRTAKGLREDRSKKQKGDSTKLVPAPARGIAASHSAIQHPAEYKSICVAVDRIVLRNVVIVCASTINSICGQYLRANRKAPVQCIQRKRTIVDYVKCKQVPMI